MQSELFASVPVIRASIAPDCPAQNPDDGQWFTPAWFSELLYDAHFSHLGAQDMVLDPGTGLGASLEAVPAHVPAVGVEINPQYARAAAQRTGRRVIVGDLRNVELPERITAVFGNPKFETSLIEALLERCASRMPLGCKVGLILPTYMFQTSSTVVRFNRQWSIRQELIPRDLFKWPTQMKTPLLFALFTRDSAPTLVGFRGYAETNDIRQLDEKHQKLFDESFSGPRSAWREILATVLGELGGEAPLSVIYGRIEGRRPTGNPYWKEQIRKVARSHFRRVADGVYALPCAA